MLMALHWWLWLDLVLNNIFLKFEPLLSFSRALWKSQSWDKWGRVLKVSSLSSHIQLFVGHFFSHNINTADLEVIYLAYRIQRSCYLIVIYVTPNNKIGIVWQSKSYAEQSGLGIHSSEQLKDLLCRKLLLPCRVGPLNSSKNRGNVFI